MGITLQVGKRYKKRNGEITGVIRVNALIGASAFRYTDAKADGELSFFNTWEESGKHMHDRDSIHDLVALYEPRTFIVSTIDGHTENFRGTEEEARALLERLLRDRRVSHGYLAEMIAEVESKNVITWTDTHG
jgi:hypothetical protein